MSIPSWLLTSFSGLGSVCRLGLATRGGTHLSPADIQYALEQGVDFLNWCGHPDALSQTIASLGKNRDKVKVCVQFEARTAAEAGKELDHILRELHTDHVDVLTFYYVEAGHEWEAITASGGALEYCRNAQRGGKVRVLGLTTHQRPLGAEIARSGLVDMLMIRYNAAHRGAERQIFPVTAELGMPVVVYTCLRWGALLEATPEDPPGYSVPRAPDWYRFALHHPAATVALMAPDDRAELEEDLSLLHLPRLGEVEYQRLASHAQRFRQRSFP